jgi:parvulin-like peptidyl-prolyl isomerase
MTSPTDPPKVSLTERVTELIPWGSSNSTGDPEERHTRNVTMLFAALIALAAIIIIVGLGFGFYDANLKPLASVNGSDVGRGEYEDRIALETFRLDRAETAVRAGLADGSLDTDLANRRLTTINNELAAVGTGSMERLVDLRYQQQLAAEEGVTLSEDELAAAIAADGTAPEARRVSALVVLSSQEELGLPATPEGHAEAQARAEQALADLQAGVSFADVADEYSPATADLDGDLGYLQREDLSDAVWAEAVFALGEGETSGIIEGENDELLISRVTEIVPEQPDPRFLIAVDDAVGDSVHRRNVELEALAEKLQEHISAEAVAKDFDQVQLSEILISGDTFVDPETDEGTIRASHILYTPGDDPQNAPAEDDPVWAEAEAEAQRAADELRVVEDVETREWAFAARARNESDGPSGVSGGDLGYFARAAMVPEFADALFDDQELVKGDIVGPVRSDFGWHVIKFDDRTAPIAEQVAEVEEALAADGADFAAVAMEYSDGAEALAGGETGWHVLDDLDDLSSIVISAAEIGGVTEAVEGDQGYYIYLKQDEATRPLDAEDATRLAASAFLDWYEDLRFEAEDAGKISIDDSLYDDGQDAQQAPARQAPAHGG